MLNWNLCFPYLLQNRENILYLFFCQSCGSNTVFTIMQIRVKIFSYCLREMSEKRGKLWLRLWPGCWCQTDLYVQFRNCWEIFMHICLHSLHSMVQKTKHIVVNDSSLGGNETRERSEKNGQAGSNWQEGCVKWNNHSLQPPWAEKYFRMCNASHHEVGGV